MGLMSILHMTLHRWLARAVTAHTKTTIPQYAASLLTFLVSFCGYSLRSRSRKSRYRNTAPGGSGSTQRSKATSWFCGPRRNRNSSKYQQERNFYYLTGFDEPDAILLLDAAAIRPRNSSLCRNESLTEERWTGVKLGPGPEAEKATGFAKVLPTSDFDAALKRASERAKAVYGLKDVEDDIAVSAAGQIANRNCAARKGDSDHDERPQEPRRKRSLRAPWNTKSRPRSNMNSGATEPNGRDFRRSWVPDHSRRFFITTRANDDAGRRRRRGGHRRGV